MSSRLGRVRTRVRRDAGLAARVARAAARTRTHASFPVEQGRLVVPGAGGRVEVVRDRWGVPHVFASNDLDAFFGHGFVHAQDRLFRMEGARRLAAGRLAEVTGPEALPSDRLMRRVGLARAARRDAASLPASSREALEAYARGVNAGISTLPALPPEFVLLGDRLEPWTASDSLLLGQLVAFGFSGNWVTELVRERLAGALGPERAALLDPIHAPATTVTGLVHPRTVDHLRAAYEVASRFGLPPALASNAWAVDGRRSATGRPLLASDPHVEVALPGLFHVAHLMGGDVNVVGAGVPGIPGVLIGHSEGVAWGITAGMADVSDCYVEEFEPSEPGAERRRYRTPEGWADADEVVEVIDVLGAPSVEERVLITRHGPIIGPALGDDRAIALRTTVIEGGDAAAPFLGLARALSYDQADAAIAGWVGATFNFVLATTRDEIGYRFAGRVPGREHGAGLLPQSGATSAGPPAPLPAAELPQFRAPTSGIVVSANNAPGGPAELGEEWCEPRRAERIEALLKARSTHDLDSFAAIQQDRYSANLVRLRDVLVQAPSVAGAIESDLRTLLSGWDGYLETSSAAGAVLLLVYRDLAATLSERVAGSHATSALGGVARPMPANSAFAYRSQVLHVEVIEEARAPWFASIDDRDRVLRGTVARAAETLQSRCGNDPARWSIGAIQRLPLHHALRAVPGLGQWWSRGAHPFGGDINTVVQAQGWPGDEHGLLRIAPGYRQVIEVGDWDRSRFMLPTGSSGIPGHPRYDDCIDEYLAGEYRPLLFSESAIRLAAEATLVLDPASDASTEGAQP